MITVDDDNLQTMVAKIVDRRVKEARVESAKMLGDEAIIYSHCVSRIKSLLQAKDQEKDEAVREVLEWVETGLGLSSTQDEVSKQVFKAVQARLASLKK